MSRSPKSRNPIAKAVTRVRPQVVPDKRRKLLDQVEHEEPSSPLDDLMPANPIMAAAWAGSLRYALGREDVLVAFREETGNRWEPSRTPIERMIDEASGAELDFIRAFAKWHNENNWGEVDGRPMDVDDYEEGRSPGREVR